MNTNKTLERTEIAALMGCKAGSAISRLVALGYTETCGRCGGGGRYSWNATNGDTCFGCAGAGKVLAKITETVVAEALARIEAGELAGYFAEHKAKREIEAANKALWAAYMGNTISSTYTKARSTPATRERRSCAEWRKADTRHVSRAPLTARVRRSASS